MSARFIELLFGITLLLAGSELTLRGSAGLARKLRLPLSIIALTIAIGSPVLPLLIVGLQSSASGSPDIMLGSVIGSSISILLLITGLAALNGRLTPNRWLIDRDGWIAVAAASLLTICSLDEQITRADGLLLLAAALAYSIYSWRSAAQRPVDELLASITFNNCGWCAVAYIFTGFALLFTAADMAVDAALTLGRMLHISETTVGMLLLGTLLTVPQAIASFGAVQQRRFTLVTAIALSNVIYIILIVTGISAFFTPLPVASAFLQTGLWLMMGAILLYVLWLSLRSRLTRAEGAVFVALFIAYGVYEYFFNR